MNAGVNEITARVLYNRGCRTKKGAESFFDVSEEKYYSPLLLPDMEKAVKIIKAAIRDRKKITVFGDYDAGTNHTLPTMGAARYTGGVSVFNFLKICTFQNVSSEGVTRIGRAAVTMAENEGLTAHANAARIRLK